MTDILLLPEFQKFMNASAAGRRLMPSGKKIHKNTLMQYQTVCKLLNQFESERQEPLRIRLLYRNSMRLIQKEKTYWDRFFRQFCFYLYRQRNVFDNYAASVFRILKTFFQYLAVERALPVGQFHKKFRVPPEQFTPVILTPGQLSFLITSAEFNITLPPHLKRTKDIFVFGCTVGLRYSDLMQLRKIHLQYQQQEVSLLLHTQKTGAEVRIPLPPYAVGIIKKYHKSAGRFVLPRLSGTNLNLQVKELIRRAGWDHPLPRIRHRQGCPVEIKTAAGQTYRFCDHITAHTMRRTTITTLLMLGVDESVVRRISGHAAGSKEFYRYVVVVQDYLNSKVKAAQQKLVSPAALYGESL